MTKTVMYRVAERQLRCNTKCSKVVNFYSHYFHAVDHCGVVLFTTDSKLLPEAKRFIFALKDEEKAFIADIKELGTYPDEPNFQDAKVPSQWEKLNEDEKEQKYNWYVLENVKELPKSEWKNYIGIKKGGEDFRTVLKDSRVYNGAIELIEKS